MGKVLFKETSFQKPHGKHEDKFETKNVHNKHCCKLEVEIPQKEEIMPLRVAFSAFVAKFNLV